MSPDSCAVTYDVCLYLMAPFGVSRSGYNVNLSSLFGSGVVIRSYCIQVFSDYHIGV